MGWVTLHQWPCWPVFPVGMKLPELGKGLGEGIRALKNGMKDNDAKPEIKAETKPVTPENPENKA